MNAPVGDPAAVGRFRIESQLGAGALGRLMLGVDETGRRVAVRLLPADVGTDPAFRDRFRRDVQLAAGAPPWFAAPVLDADPGADPPWVATAYVEGPTLAAYVGAHGALGTEGIFALATRMVDGLVALHAAGLVHRNLSPITVLLADDGPRVVDVGISIAAGPQGGPVTDSPDYLAPEQASGVTDVTAAADMFAFGTLLLFAATARSPFAADSTAGTLYRIAYSEADLGPLTGRVRVAVEGCLKKDPGQRPSAVQLRDYLRGEGEAAAPDPAGPTMAVASVEPPAEPTQAITRSAPPGWTPAPPPPPGWRPDLPPLRQEWTPPSAPTSRRRLPFVAIAAAVVLVVGLAVGAVLLLKGGGPAAAKPAATAAAPPTRLAPSTRTFAPPTTTSTGSASGAADPTVGAVVVDAAADPRFGASGASFASPSHNITCAMTAAQVRCDVAERTWAIPPAPLACTQGYGSGAVLTGTRGGELSCGAATTTGATAVLAYDTGVRLGDVVCVSRESGVECQNTSSRHGFQVARAAYTLY